MEEAPDLPPEALEDIAYLSRSENRVRLLSTIATTPTARADLKARTGIASTTIGRILNEFQTRGWVERSADGAYQATPTGTLVVHEFGPLVESMATINRLGDAAGWLPIDELSIDIHHFREADIVRPAANAPFELVEDLADRLREATSFRVLTFLEPPEPVGAAMEAGVGSGRLTAEHVLAGGLVSFLRDQEKQTPDWPAYIDAGAEVHQYAGHIPCNLFITDETVLIMSDRPEGGGGVIVSSNETVAAAANDLFETYRDAADPVEAEAFT